MKESRPTQDDEKTGGLSGAGRTRPEEQDDDEADKGLAGQLGGIIPSRSVASAAGMTGLRMPDRLNGVVLDGGRPVGLDLPDLGDREVVAAWRKAIGAGPLYVRCLDRARPLAVSHAQRLARVGELWLDSPLPSEDVGFDLMVAGAHRLIVWPHEAPDGQELLHSLGDSAVIGWDGRGDWAATAALATELAIPVLCAAEAPAPAPGLDLYRVDLAARGRFTVERTQAVPEDVPADPTEPADGEGTAA